MVPDVPLTIGGLTITDDTLKIIGGSVLAASFAVAWLVFRSKEANPIVRGLLGFFALALTAWGLWLFTNSDIEKSKAEAAKAQSDSQLTKTIAECKQTLDEVHGLAVAKLASVQTQKEAKAIGKAIIDTIENSSCK